MAHTVLSQTSKILVPLSEKILKVNMYTSIASPFSFSVYTIYSRLVPLLVCNCGKHILSDSIRNYLIGNLYFNHCYIQIDTNSIAKAIFLM